MKDLWRIQWSKQLPNGISALHNHAQLLTQQRTLSLQRLLTLLGEFTTHSIVKRTWKEKESPDLVSSANVCLSIFESHGKPTKQEVLCDVNSWWRKALCKGWLTRESLLSRNDTNVVGITFWHAVQPIAALSCRVNEVKPTTLLSLNLKFDNKNPRVSGA